MSSFQREARQQVERGWRRRRKWWVSDRFLDKKNRCVCVCVQVAGEVVSVFATPLAGDEVCGGEAAERGASMAQPRRRGRQ